MNEERNDSEQCAEPEPEDDAHAVVPMPALPVVEQRHFVAAGEEYAGDEPADKCCYRESDSEKNFHTAPF